MKDLGGLVRQYLEYCEVEKGKSTNTIINYNHYLMRFLFWANKNQIQNPNDLNLEKIRQYRLYLNHFNQSSLSKKTQNYHIIALRAFLKYLIKNDIATLAPEKIELSKQNTREINFLSPDELQKIFAEVSSKNTRGLRDKAILEVLFSTGLRVSELVNLDVEKINFKNNEFSVQGKGEKSRIVFLSPAALVALKNYLNQRRDNFKPLFIDHHKNIDQNNDNSKINVRLTARTIQRIIKKYATLAGIAKKVTPHVMRHSFGTDLLRNGADLRAVQQLLGHSSITTTQIYTHVTDQHLRDVHQKFHGKK